MSERNWAGNLTYAAQRLELPRSVDDVAELVARADTVKVLGSRHSFNDVADTTGTLVSLADLPQDVTIAPDRRSVDVPAAMRYGDLALILEREGLALHAMASLPHISVAGAVATSTHGSGDRSGSLATAVAGLEVVRSDGQVVRLTRERDADVLAGAVVSLGALGVVTRVRLDVASTYQVRQHVYEGLPWEALDAHLDDITSRAQSVSFFTRWGAASVAQVWLKAAVAQGADGSDGTGTEVADLFGARPSLVDLHPLPGQSAATCTVQRGVAGPWHERLPHFRLEYTPSNGEEVQSEYLIERAALPAAVAGLRPLAALLDPLLIMSELRTVAADDLWLSPAYRRDVVAVHFTFVRDQAGVQALLPAVEHVLLPLGARPHWAKLFTVTGEQLTGRYPRYADFRALREQWDPRGAFVNPFLQRVGLAD